MKYLLLVALAVVLVWWWRALSRKTHTGEGGQTQTPVRAAPQDIVACRHCGLHLPRAEAVSSAAEVYCSEAHRRAAEERADRP